MLNIPEWELKCGFDPTTVTVRDKPAWVTLNTSDIPLPTNFPRAEDVLKNNAPFDVCLHTLHNWPSSENTAYEVYWSQSVYL
jgi:hypothetical protein